MRQQKNQSVNGILSKEDKIKKLSDEAIEDIYARQLVLKIAKKRMGYIKESSDLFKSCDVNEPNHHLYEAIKDIDIQLYTRLNRKDSTIEKAILDEFTKQTDASKVEIMRHKLIKTSECCGVPRANLCHNNIDGWAELEEL
jgi:hypothetical protein